MDQNAAVHPNRQAQHENSSRALRIARARVWRSTLTILGVLALIGGLILTVLSLVQHQVTTVNNTLTNTAVTKVVTDTGAGPPSTAVISGFLAAGVVLLITAAFFNRITELDFAGVTVKMVTAAATVASKADELSRGPGTPSRSQILKKTAELALGEHASTQQAASIWRQALRGDPTEIDSLSADDVVDRANALVQRAADQLETATPEQSANVT